MRDALSAIWDLLNPCCTKSSIVLMSKLWTAATHRERRTMISSPRSHPENFMQSIVAKDLDEKKIVAIISVERLAFSGLGSEVMYIPLFFVLLVLPYLHPPWEKDVGLHFLSPEKMASSRCLRRFM